MTHDPRSGEDLAYEDALERCESLMRTLRRWKHVYVENQGLLRCKTMLSLGDRLSEVVEDNIRGCVMQAKEEFLRRERGR